MLFPKKKAEDMAARALMLEALELCVRTGQMESAKAIGQASKQMADKIAATYPARSWEEYEKILHSGAKDIPTYQQFKEKSVVH